MKLKVSVIKIHISPTFVIRSQYAPVRFFLAYQYSYNQDGGYLFAKEITFEVKLQNDNPQSHSFMNIPVLKITYGHQDELGETQEFSFTSNYYMDISFIMKWITGLFYNSSSSYVCLVYIKSIKLNQRNLSMLFFNSFIFQNI